VCVSYPEGNRPLEGSMPRWEDTIVTDLEEIGYEGVGRVKMTYSWVE
jgi:hypothetical protein